MIACMHAFMHSHDTCMHIHSSACMRAEPPRHRSWNPTAAAHHYQRSAAQPGSTCAASAASAAAPTIPLWQVRWRRVVLDECHAIKDRRCSTAKAVFALTAKYRWALSGTPLQARGTAALSRQLLLPAMCTRGH